MALDRQKVSQWLTTDNAGLVILGGGMMGRAWSYMPWNVPDTYRLPTLEASIPVTAWAVLWIVAGVACITGAVLNRRIAHLYGIAIGFHFLWGMLYLMASVVGESERGYVTSIQYFTIVAFIFYTIHRGSRQRFPKLPDGGPYGHG